MRRRGDSSRDRDKDGNANGTDSGPSRSLWSTRLVRGHRFTPAALRRAVGSVSRARDAQHDLSGGDRGEDENRADGEVDPAGDNHKRLSDRQNENNRRVDGEHRKVEA